ncbi:integral membrane YwaF-like protein [Mycoplasma testudineum]|uniref:Integral membrane YwaF-like protein n=1 Tax=Mycoplasma testudineum TaxID=244584 RepID=A0A4R6IFD3_9MOLU|nr:YwaF family protein [Mycoplasma testudineum]OYD26813.1 hypothetical protein CG473_01740 [Mycoplasma testudineum]TDO20347.1 integral membrane YwaF-like protein [Mycoplasma testudineum]
MDLKQNSLLWQGQVQSPTWNDAGQKPIFFSIFIIVLLLLIILSFFSATLSIKFKTQIASASKAKLIINIAFSIVGALILSHFMLRTFVILNVFSPNNNLYPRLWEAIPLHWSRLLILVNIFYLFAGHKIRSSEYMHFSAYISVITGIAALTTPDLSGNIAVYGVEVKWGSRSLVFWDYLVTHLENVFIPWILLLLYRPKLTFRRSYQIVIVIFSYLMIMLMLNSFTAISKDLNWHANWAYVSISSDINPFVSNLAPPLTKFPLHVITYTILFGTLSYLGALIYYFSDKAFAKFNKNFEAMPKWEINWNFKEKIKKLQSKFKLTKHKQ